MPDKRSNSPATSSKRKNTNSYSDHDSNERELSAEEIETRLRALRARAPGETQNTERLASSIGYERKHGGLPATKKSLGQNWLRDSFATQQIVQLLNPGQGDNILEVGPGPGTLTQYLLQYDARVTVVEIDGRMLEALKPLAEKHKNLRLIHADVLQEDFHELMEGNTFSMIGNLPFHITSTLLFKVLDHARSYPGLLKRLVVMVQLEVAERIVANPGDNEYSILSVFMGLFGNPCLALTVPRDQFSPPPRVDAGVLVMDVAEQPLYPLPDWLTFKRIVKGVFNKRRKMMRNTMPGIKGIGDWRKIDFDWSRRPQTVSVEEYAWLASQLVPKKTKTMK